MTYEQFCSHIKTLMAACGGRHTSWWRSPHGNEEVGGHRYSRHMIGEAVDWNWSEAELKATEFTDSKGHRTNGRERLLVMAPRLGLKVLDEDDHVHVQTP